MMTQSCDCRHPGAGAFAPPAQGIHALLHFCDDQVPCHVPVAKRSACMHACMYPFPRHQRLPYVIGYVTPLRFCGVGDWGAIGPQLLLSASPRRTHISAGRACMGCDALPGCGTFVPQTTHPNSICLCPHVIVPWRRMRAGCACPTSYARLRAHSPLYRDAQCLYTYPCLLPFLHMPYPLSFCCFIFFTASKCTPALPPAAGHGHQPRWC